jgi:hypothetical protein
MAYTIERRKIKGGNYEFFTADDDGNIVEMVNVKDLVTAITALRYLADDGDIDAKKAILDFEILMNFVVVDNKKR